MKAFAFIKDYKTIVNNLRNTSNRLRLKARRGDAVVAVQDVQAWTVLQVVPRGGVCGGGSGLGLCGGGGGHGDIALVLIVVHGVGMTVSFQGGYKRCFCSHVAM